MLNDSKITSSNEKEVLGILLDGKLNFENHLSYLCKKQVKNSFPTLRSRINGGGGGGGGSNKQGGWKFV